MGVSRDKPRGIQCMPSGFMPVVIDLRPRMKVTIPWDKPRGATRISPATACLKAQRDPMADLDSVLELGLE
jgi:hypothetical protein